jgi:hypothetical protein
LGIFWCTIGWIFVFWAIRCFGQFIHYRSSPNVWASFYHGKSYVHIYFHKKELGYILGDFSETHLVTLPRRHAKRTYFYEHIFPSNFSIFVILIGRKFLPNYLHTVGNKQKDLIDSNRRNSSNSYVHMWSNSVHVSRISYVFTKPWLLVLIVG